MAQDRRFTHLSCKTALRHLPIVGFVAWVLLFLTAPHVRAVGNADGPDLKNVHASARKGVMPFYRPFAKSAIYAYQRLISPTKGSSCPMHPHCSLYGQIAFSKYDPIRAFMMTADRLHRCGHDLSKYRITIFDNSLRFDDPVQWTVNEREALAYDYGSQDSPDTSTISPNTYEANEQLYGLYQDSLLYRFARMLQLESDLVSCPTYCLHKCC